MIVEMNRWSATSLDDAHQLNRLITKNHSNFTPEFIQEWNQSYQSYCKDKEPIMLKQGDNS